MDRRWYGVLFALTVALPLGGDQRPEAQEPAASNRVTWTAEWKHESLAPPDHARERIGPHHKWRVRFSGVQEPGGISAGAQRGWVSRQYDWTYQYYLHHTGFARDPDTNFRWWAKTTIVCTGGDVIDLGPTEGEHNEGLTAVQLSCVATQTPAEGQGRFRTARETRTGYHILNHPLQWPRQGCADGEVRREVSQDGTVETSSWSVTVSPVVAARVEVKWDSRRAALVGEKVELEGSSPVPVHWKFELGPVSNLRGYATNADITPAFFEIYKLPKLRDHYRTLAPDLIFDPFFYEEQWQRSDWKRPYPESGPRKWSTLESAQTSNRAFVNVTMMDYGGHGELRAFVASGCGGGWVPVPILPRYDSTQGLMKLKIPEDKDGNFMADAFEHYRGLSALDDEDPEPKGDGTPGDGFTAFEEYRGFVRQVGPTCDPLKVKHVRTNPKVKDLFIRASDPLLREIVFQQFGVLTDLDVHTICPEQYVDDQTRIVNFTMQRNPGEAVRGARLTQDRPQHGLYLVNAPAGGGLYGRSSGFGPPRNVTRVAVDIPRIRAAQRSRFEDYLRVVTHHELGHAVGIRHHGDWNIWGPVVLLNTPGCVVGMTEGQVGGQPACSASSIAIRGQQNSGNAFCPMKYLNWSWYVPPGWSLRDAGEVDFRPDTSWSWSRPRVRDAYVLRMDPPDTMTNPPTLTSRPQLRRYRKDLDNPPSWTDEQFCTSPTGTGINELPLGDENHAGDASRKPPCVEQLRVNDVARDTPPQ